jgi:SAM-dependent methyltransferase
MLYARYNQPRHLEELTEAFSNLVGSSNHIGRATVLDLGCGPFTAGLAFAQVLGAAKEFRYYGIDISAAMRVVGQDLFNAAREIKAISPRTSCFFGESLDKADFGLPRGDLTIVVASYLLASPSLSVPVLIEQILNALIKVGPGPVAVLYTNSGQPHLNTKYPTFRDGLKDAGFEVKADVTETFFGTKSPKLMKYALFFRPANTTIDLPSDI